MSDNIVLTTYGKVKGRTVNGIKEFRGIPFARIKRFEFPKKFSKWEYILDCNQSFRQVFLN
jgi:carboxylesterase type B